MPQIPRILLVDDDEVTNYLHLALLEDLSVVQQVEAVTDARQALRIVEEECPSQKCPNLIFLDLKMPVFDGFDFLQAFQSLPSIKTERTTIIVLTTSTSPKDVQRLQKLGSYQLVNKPLTKEKLLALVA